MRCTKCGRVLRSDESRCPLCGAPAESPAETHPAKTRIIPLKYSKAEPVEKPVPDEDEPDEVILPDACAEIEDVAEAGENPSGGEKPAAAILPSESYAPAEETEEPAPIPEPVFLEPDPELDALTDSITAAVAAAIHISVIPHEGAVSTTSDSVSGDTDPLELPEEVKAMLPDAEPPAPQKPTSLEQTTEEGPMKPVAKKIRKPVRFHFAYIIPALILSVLLLAGAILFAINSLLTPIKMPEQSTEQQTSDTAKDTDTAPTDDSAAFIGGLYFDF